MPDPDASAAASPEAGEDVVIRVPMPLRAWIVAFLIFWCGSVVWTTMIRHHGASILVGVVFIAIAVTFGYRLFRGGVWACADGRLVVRNPPSTRRFTRADVEDFRVSSLTGRGPLRATGIVVLLREGSVLPITVTQAAPWRRRQRQEADLARLRAWLSRR